MIRGRGREGASGISREKRRILGSGCIVISHTITLSLWFVDETAVGGVDEPLGPEGKVIARELTQDILRGSICSRSILNGHLLKCKVSVATDPQAKTAKVVLNTEGLGTALAMHLPLR